MQVLVHTKTLQTKTLTTLNVREYFKVKLWPSYQLKNIFYLLNIQTVAKINKVNMNFVMKLALHREVVVAVLHYADESNNDTLITIIMTALHRGTSPHPPWICFDC